MVRVSLNISLLILESTCILFEHARLPNEEHTTTISSIAIIKTQR